MSNEVRITIPSMIFNPVTYRWVPYDNTISFHFAWPRERWWDHDVNDLVVVER